MSVPHDFLGSRDLVAQFLFYGHVMSHPGYRSLVPRWDRSSGDADESVEHLLGQADKELQSAVGEIDVDRTHVVPLSGGLDSRLLVVNLVDSGVPRRNIRTATYGLPGTLDYEYGRLVAQALGVEHVEIDTRRRAPTVSDMEAAAGVRPNPGWLIGVHYNRLIRERFGPDVVYWSGVAAGQPTDLRPLGDGSLAEWKAWSSWTAYYADHFAAVPPGVLTPDDWDPRAALPADPVATTEQAEPWDQLMMEVHSRCSSVPEHADPDCDVRMPYLAESWVGFWLDVRPELRHAQALYRQLVAQLSPPVVRRIPVKGYAHPDRWHGRKVLLARARGRATGRSGLNYLDFSQELRDGSATFTRTVKALVQRVHGARVAPWVDTERLWAAHLDGTDDHGLALTHLASLGAYCTT